MSAGGFRGRGLAPRGRNIRVPPGGVMGARNPQPNFNQPRREGHGPPPEYWLDHPPAVPWQQINGGPQFSGFEPHRYRGRPPFCPGIGPRGRSKRIRGEGRPRLGIPPAPGFGGNLMARPEPEPARFAPLGSEEERQQKIAETADKLKQKLSSLAVGEPVNFWEDDLSGVSFNHDEEHLVANKGIPELRHDPPELNLTVNDFKDIGRVDPDAGVNSGDYERETDAERVQGAREKTENTKNWRESEHRNHINDGSDVTELANDLDNDTIPRSDEIPLETGPRLNAAFNSSRNGSQGVETEQVISERLNCAPVPEKRLLPPKFTEDQLSSVIGRAAAKALEKKSSSDAKPELTKSLERLREVIKVDRELEKEGKSTFQPNSGPRPPPDVRLDFHPGDGPVFPRFQGYAHPTAPHDPRGRYRAPFRVEHGMDCPPNFGQDFQPRFDHRPELQPRNFGLQERNIHPRIIHPEFGPQGQELGLGFDPREPPPRFNVNPRLEHPGGQPWFNRNEAPRKFGINGLQPPPGFDPRGPPPGFANQEQDVPVFGPNLIPGADFPPMVPMGYPQVPHMGMGHGPGYFNLGMPPPNTAPCIIPKFPTPVPIPALDIQAQILRRPPSPPSLPPPSAVPNVPTPNMNDELEDMQEALEFAKKLMNMTEEEETQGEGDQEFDMPVFPDLPPIPSTEPSHLEEMETRKEAEITKPEGVEEPPFQFGPRNCQNEEERRGRDLRDEDEVEEEMLEEISRPKVAFNLNSRSKMIPQPSEWKQQIEAGTSREKSSKEKVAEDQRKKSPQEERPKEILRESRSNRKGRIQIEEKPSGESSAKKRENNVVEATTPTSSKTQEDTTGKSRPSKTSKSLSAATVDANWKDKVINQFLKMSKNDICNMVNSSGLRKFDIAMKHLVKERKYSLSHERRCSADDAVKEAAYSAASSSSSSYDMSREEFMLQLSAMLDPSATVDVKNLPSKFIQHLSEVLKLDVQSHLNENAEPLEQNDRLPQEDGFFPDPELHGFALESLENSYLPPPSNCADETETLANDVKAEVEVAQDFEAPTESSLFDNGAVESLHETVPDMAVIDDIFSEGIARAKQGQKLVVETERREEKSRDFEGEFAPQGLIRARCTRTLMSEENVDLDDIFSAGIARAKQQIGVKNFETEEGFQSAESSWGRKNREDPDMFRNLTKEEWEARCAKYGDNELPASLNRDVSIGGKLRSPRGAEQGSRTQKSNRNLSPPSPRAETTLAPGEESESEESSSSGCSSNAESPKVSKLLKAVKGREKSAKDQVHPEVERPRAREKENRKKEKSKRRKERREKRRARRKRKSIENEDKLRAISPIKLEADIKQEELIIEPDNVAPFVENSVADREKSNSQSAVVERIEEPERDEPLAQLESVVYNQETLDAPELEAESSALQLADAGVELNESEECGSAENCLGKLENTKETKDLSNSVEIQLSKSGAKKIDIKAYKARKLQRNNERRGKAGETEAKINVERLLDPRLSQGTPDTAAKDVAKETRNKDVKSASKKDSEEPPKEKKSQKREEERSSREKSVKGDKTTEKVETKSTRTRSRDSDRSTSREEGRRTSKERSRNSREKREQSRSISRDKSAQNNNVVEVRGAKSSRVKTCHSPKEAVDSRIEKRLSRSKKHSDEGPGDKESRRQSKTVTDSRKETKDQLQGVLDCDLPKSETTDLPQGPEDAADLKKTHEVLGENLETQTTEVNTEAQAGPANFIDTMEDQNHGELPSLEDLDKDKPADVLASEIESREDGIHLEKTETGGCLFQNDAEDSAVLGKDVLKSGGSEEPENESVGESQRNEAAKVDQNETVSESVEPLETNLTHEAEASLEKAIGSDLEKSCQNDIKTILNELIEKAISQLDLLSGKNEAKETPVSGENDERLGSVNGNEHRFGEFVEDNSLELDSPQTPESPLKGFSEDSIKSSILGKRKLDQSVMEIAEDYKLNKRSKDLETFELDTVSEDANLPNDREKLIPGQDIKRVDPALGKIDSLEALDTSIPIEEADPKAICHTDEASTRCVTPSGDTLSLGSSIDIDNSEFVVLSEISSEEYFSQDEDRGVELKAGSENRELAEKAEEIKEIGGAGKGEGESGDKTTTGEASKTNPELPATKSSKDKKHKAKTTHSKLRVGESSEKPSTAQDIKNELEINPNNTVKADPAPNLVAELKGESTEQSAMEQVDRVKETQNVDKKLVKNEVLSETSSCKPASKKAEDESSRKKNSESKKPSKPDDPKGGKSLPRDVSAGENNADKNLHRIKHRHRTKHKKERKYRLSERQVKEVLKEEDLVTIVKKRHTKEGVMARMIEIDLEIQKLMSEKMKLYQMLESGELPTEQSSAAKEESESVAESSNTPLQETHQHSSSVETSTSSAKQKSSGSGSGSQQKSSKIVSEEDGGSRHSGVLKDVSVKKSRRPHKHEKTSKQDNLVQNETKKPLVDRPVDSKSSVSRRKHSEEKSSSKKSESHSRSSSSSNRRKDEETHSSKKEELGKKTLAREILEENTQRSKKPEHHSSPKKKVSKIQDPKEELLRWMKREEQLFGANSETETRSVDVAGAETPAPEKLQSVQIYSDEGSQLSLTQENKGAKKTPVKGLALLEETYKRERAMSRKRRAALCRRKKERLKSLQNSALSPSEEEMPLDLLYSKKFQRKLEQPAKRATSDEVLEHILEAINAVAENKTEEYQRSDKSKAERLPKVSSKARPADDLANSATDEAFGVLWPFDDVQSGKSLAENLSEDDFRDVDEFGEPPNTVGSETVSSAQETQNRFPVDKMVEISGVNDGIDLTADKVSLFENICGGKLDDDLGEAENSQLCCRFSPASNAFSYINEMGQLEDSNSGFIPPDDQMSHSNSISRNLDIEKGLDVLDSMLETVGSDLEGVSPKDVHSGFVKRGKRKRVVSGDSDVSSKRRNHPISRSEMMNCSVRLVDCKYTYLKNCWNTGAAQRFTICPTETTISDLPSRSNATSLKTQSSTESHPRTPKSKSPVLPQALSEEPPDWSLEDQRLIECVENLPGVNSMPSLIPGSDLSLNHIDEGFSYDEDDLEIIKLHASNHVGEEETGNWQSIDKIQEDCTVESVSAAETTIVTLDIGAEPAEEELAAEVILHAKPASKVVEAKESQQELLLGSGNSVVGEEAATAQCSDDIEVISQSKDRETNEVQEVELPRIQYSVHKGPILDVKVFGDSILAASEDGIIYRYSQTCNGILNTYEGHKSAVTCIHVLHATPSSTDWLFSSSLDGSLRCFDITTSHQVRGAADVGSPVQCMDQSWGMIFLGTKSGYVFRFHIKSHAFKGDEIKFSEESVLALKATTEGPRRVLIVASRSQPITIRDAQSGLFLRTVSGHKSHTVYSLMMDSNLVYCGTSSTAIPVFDFINGTQVKLYNAGPGIVCMRMYKWLLFAGCYDGNIYVFDTKEQRLVCSIPGPGNMLLSMDIVKNKIVAGSKDRRLHMWQMPDQVLTLLVGRT